MSDKKETAETGGGAAGKAASDQKASSPSSKEKRSRGKLESSAQGPRQEHIPSKPAQFTDMMRERAEKLATLRRGWFDEFTWGALGGLIASIPGLVHTVSDVEWQHFSLNADQSVDSAIFLFFLALTLSAFFRSGNKGPSAMEYLDHHFGQDADGFAREPRIIRVRRWFAQRWTELTKPL